MSTQAKGSLKKSVHKGKIYIKNNHIYFSMRCKNNSNM